MYRSNTNSSFKSSYFTSNCWILISQINNWNMFERLSNFQPSLHTGITGHVHPFRIGRWLSGNQSLWPGLSSMVWIQMKSSEILASDGWSGLGRCSKSAGLRSDCHSLVRGFVRKVWTGMFFHLHQDPLNWSLLCQRRLVKYPCYFWLIQIWKFLEKRKQLIKCLKFLNRARTNRLPL